MIMTTSHALPVVLCFSGLDSTGGAGLQADIEAVLSMGCHAAPVATALTVQDTHTVSAFQAVDPELLQQQASAVLEDMPVAAIKIGMTASKAVVDAIHKVLQRVPDIPVVFDPVLNGGGGGNLSHADLALALGKLLPHTTVLTPNVIEARALATGMDDIADCGQALLNCGCDYVLITGGDEESEHVVNHLYGKAHVTESFRWERLPHQFHGSGCTLAASMAALLARGLEPFTAIHEAQEYTWESLQHAHRIGRGQHIPNRLFWARDDADD